MRRAERTASGLHTGDWIITITRSRSCCPCHSTGTVYSQETPSDLLRNKGNNVNTLRPEFHPMKRRNQPPISVKIPIRMINRSEVQVFIPLATLARFP